MQLNEEYDSNKETEDDYEHPESDVLKYDLVNTVIGEDDICNLKRNRRSENMKSLLKEQFTEVQYTTKKDLVFIPTNHLHGSMLYESIV